MKLMLRPEWKPRPVGSFLGCLDLKLGVTIALLFAVCPVQSYPNLSTDLLV